MSAGGRLDAPRLAAQAILAWAPLWVPVGLGVQIALLGLRPALQEHRRLEAEEAVLLERRDELAAERALLDDRERAQRDPLFLERERRSLRDPDSDLAR